MDTSMATFYKKLAVEESKTVAVLAAEYAANPDSDVWCRLENANRRWAEYHNIWRAMACHKL
jgi:hypothetical protein